MDPIHPLAITPEANSPVLEITVSKNEFDLQSIEVERLEDELAALHEQMGEIDKLKAALQNAQAHIEMQHTTIQMLVKLNQELIQQLKAVAKATI